MIKTILMKHKYTLLFLAIIAIMGIFNPSSALNVFKISADNIMTMIGVIPPIFVFIGLLDVWIPKDTMIKYMGDNSGILGLFFAFLLGSLAAGPLYVAFPIAALLLKKGARFAYVIFFLGTWTAAKIPLILFEMTSLGVRFTLIHVSTMLILYLVGAFYLESLLAPHEKESILLKLETI